MPTETLLCPPGSTTCLCIVLRKWCARNLVTGEVLRPCVRGLTGSVTAQRESSPLIPHPCPFARPSKARSVAFERLTCYVRLLLKARGGRKQPSAMPCISTRAAVGTRCGVSAPCPPCGTFCAHAGSPQVSFCVFTSGFAWEPPGAHSTRCHLLHGDAVPPRA